MKFIETFFTYGEIEKLDKKISFDGIIVIDVLRATSTMVTAISNGCVRIIPFYEVEEAVLFRDQFNKCGNILLCGERNSNKPANFDLGNSPLEFRKEVVDGKDIIFTTTNGTKALLKVQEFSENIYVGAFLNLSSTVNYLLKYDKLGIVCAGNEGYASYEDTQLAGKIIEKLVERKSYELSDGSKIAYSVWKAIGKTDFTGTHSRKLVELGFEKDIEFCQRIDLFDSVVKLFKSGDLFYLKKIV
ncbi:MAG: 2-phosphosulfolactate phosphatase [Fervidobacterium sp.]|nr:2-phosphosulfolactate phosphatase [Fervidobacterium sp.]